MYIWRENKETFWVISEEDKTPTLTDFCTQADPKAVYGYYQASPEAKASSRPSRGETKSSFGIEDASNYILDDDWDAGVDNGGAMALSLSKERWSNHGRYQYMLLVRNELNVSGSLSGLLQWLSAGPRTGALLFPAPSSITAILRGSPLSIHNDSFKQ